MNIKILINSKKETKLEMKTKLCGKIYLLKLNYYVIFSQPFW